jgi:hypothetical protein
MRYGRISRSRHHHDCRESTRRSAQSSPQPAALPAHDISAVGSCVLPFPTVRRRPAIRLSPSPAWLAGVAGSATAQNPTWTVRKLTPQRWRIACYGRARIGQRRSRFNAENLGCCNRYLACVDDGRLQQMRCSRPAAEILQDRPGAELSSRLFRVPLAASYSPGCPRNDRSQGRRNRCIKRLRSGCAPMSAKPRTTVVSAARAEPPLCGVAGQFRQR